jgi:hypothetical protein
MVAKFWHKAKVKIGPLEKSSTHPIDFNGTKTIGDCRRPRAKWSQFMAVDRKQTAKEVLKYFPWMVKISKFAVKSI